MKRSFSSSFNSADHDRAEARPCKAAVRCEDPIEEQERKANQLELEIFKHRGNFHEHKTSEPQIAAKKKTTVALGYENQIYLWPNPPIFWNIPEDLIRKLAEYLEDDELFEARIVNKIFYGVFYEQRVILEASRDFNFRRALKLAQMGRIFKNVEYFELWIGGTDSLTVANLNPQHFPALNFLDVFWGDSPNIGTVLDTEDIPSNQNIRTVRVADWDADWLTDERFPNIEELLCEEEVEFFPTRLSNLRMLECHDSATYFNELSTDNFPSLRKVVFNRENIDGFDHENANAAMARLRAEGVIVRIRNIIL